MFAYVYPQHVASKKIFTDEKSRYWQVAAHPRKVNLLSTHLKNTITTISILHIRTYVAIKHLNILTETTLLHSYIHLLNDLYKITAKYIKLILHVEQSGISSDMCVSIQGCTDSVILWRGLFSRVEIFAKFRH